MENKKTCFNCKHYIFKLIMAKMVDGSRCMGICDARDGLAVGAKELTTYCCEKWEEK